MVSNAQPTTNGQVEKPPMQTEPILQPQEGSTSSQSQPLSEAQKADAVAALFNGETEEKKDTSPKSEKAPETPETLADLLKETDETVIQLGNDDPLPNSKKSPKTLSEAGEQLGIEPDDLYGLTITTRDGEAISISDLKDAHQDRAATEHESATRAVALDERENAMIASQRLWAEMGDQLTANITPELRQELAEQMTANAETEHRRMLQTMPELADTAIFTQFRNDVVVTMKEYGYAEHELVVGDHRQMLVMRDLIRAKKRLKALANFKPMPTLPQQSGKSTPHRAPVNKRAQIIKAGKGGTPEQQVSAIASLLNGK